MQIEIRDYRQEDAADAAAIWNEVVEAGDAFPQTELLDAQSGHAFFAEQSYTGIAYSAETGETVGLYILHPNNIGRCGHICNASYAAAGLRGKHIGEMLVRYRTEQAKNTGLWHLQFNAVVKATVRAPALQKAGFCAARHDPRRLPHAGRRIRGYYPALHRAVAAGDKHKAGEKPVGNRRLAKIFRRYIRPGAQGKILIVMTSRCNGQEVFSCRPKWRFAG